MAITGSILWHRSLPEVSRQTEPPIHHNNCPPPPTPQCIDLECCRRPLALSPRPQRTLDHSDISLALLHVLISTYHGPLSTRWTKCRMPVANISCPGERGEGLLLRDWDAKRNETVRQSYIRCLNHRFAGWSQFYWLFAITSANVN